MNLILFSAEETALPLPRQDPRAIHLLEVLKRKPGDSFDAGLIDGPRGKGKVLEIGPSNLTLSFFWGEPPPALFPLRLIVGLPRPQTARKVLLEATSLGVAALHFVATERGEPGYAQSTLWSSGEWRRLLIAGAEQAFCTRLPKVTWTVPLETCLWENPEETRLALDNYEAPTRLSEAKILAPSVCLALGSERGWTGRERELLRDRGFRFHNLGVRVLRTETAVTAASALVLARMGLM